MKGPYQRLKYDLRRLWECPMCQHRTHTHGDVTTVLCRCQQQVDSATRRYMHLIEITPRRIQITAVTVAPAVASSEITPTEIAAAEITTTEITSTEIAPAEIATTQNAVAEIAVTESTATEIPSNLLASPVAPAPGSNAGPAQSEG